jgi:hypothetical protein
MMSTQNHAVHVNLDLPHRDISKPPLLSRQAKQSSTTGQTKTCLGKRPTPWQKPVLDLSSRHESQNHAIHQSTSLFGKSHYVWPEASLPLLVSLAGVIGRFLSEGISILDPYTTCLGDKLTSCSHSQWYGNRVQLSVCELSWVCNQACIDTFTWCQRSHNIWSAKAVAHGA